KRCLHPQGRNAVEDGKAVAGGASLARPKAGAGRDGRNVSGRFDGGRRQIREAAITSLTSQMNRSADG
ncbi:hypothetical protein ACCS68_21935, partial [Rhizobium beringeri]